MSYYPVEYLENLPIKFRRLILSYLPALDLHKLQTTQVVQDVDTSIYWKSLWNDFNSNFESLVSKDMDYRSMYLILFFELLLEHQSRSILEDEDQTICGMNMLRMIALPLLHRKEHCTSQLIVSGFCLSCKCHKFFVPQHYQYMLPNIARVRPNNMIAFLLSRELQFYDTVVAFGCRIHKCPKQESHFSPFWPNVKTMQLVNGRCCPNHDAEVDFILSSVVGTTNIQPESLMVNDSTKETCKILSHFSNISSSPQCKHFHLQRLSVTVPLFDAKFSRLVASVIQSQKLLQYLELSGSFTESEMYEEFKTELLSFMDRPIFQRLGLQQINCHSLTVTDEQLNDLSNFVYVQLLVKFLMMPPTVEKPSLNLTNIQYPKSGLSLLKNNDNIFNMSSNKTIVFDSITFDRQAFVLMQFLPAVTLKKLELSNCDIQLLESFPKNIIATELVLRNIKCFVNENTSITFDEKMLESLLMNSTITSIDIELGDYIHGSNQSMHTRSLSFAISEHAKNINSIQRVSLGYKGEKLLDVKEHIELLLSSFVDLSKKTKLDIAIINTDLNSTTLLLQWLHDVCESKNSKFNKITHPCAIPIDSELIKSLGNISNRVN